MTILQTTQEQAIFTKSKDATYSEAFQRGPLLDVLVTVKFNEESPTGSAVVYVQSSSSNSSYTNCAKFELSKSDPAHRMIIRNTDNYLRGYIESVSGGSVDMFFDAMEV